MSDADAKRRCFAQRRRSSSEQRRPSLLGTVTSSLIFIVLLLPFPVAMIPASTWSLMLPDDGRLDFQSQTASETQGHLSLSDHSIVDRSRSRLPMRNVLQPHDGRDGLRNPVRWKSSQSVATRISLVPERRRRPGELVRYNVLC